MALYQVKVIFAWDRPHEINPKVSNIATRNTSFKAQALNKLETGIDVKLDFPPVSVKTTSFPESLKIQAFTAEVVNY
jgi:hypothetical protein